VLDALAIETPILVGHSDGASISLIYAGANRPVRGLVLMAPHVFVEDMNVASIAEAKVSFQTTDLARKLRRYHAFAASTFWGWNDIWLNPAFRRWNIEQYLPAIDVPVRVIQGQDDQYGTAAQVEAITRQVRGPVDSVILSDCAHSPHVDQRDATLIAIADFVWKLKAHRSERPGGKKPGELAFPN
jgi:pimeloyl-ACP methyl ester carboxylesterase